MALPVAHCAVAWGMTESRDWRVLAFLAFLSVLPDFDFLIVWGLQLAPNLYHRTWSHSLLFCLLGALVWKFYRPARLESISPTLCFAVLTSHPLLDLLCTADTADHGIMIFWPFSDARFGWPVLVPLYRLLAEPPFSLAGALKFTLLELVLAFPLWYLVRTTRRLIYHKVTETQNEQTNKRANEQTEERTNEQTEER